MAWVAGVGTTFAFRAAEAALRFIFAIEHNITVRTPRLATTASRLVGAVAVAVATIELEELRQLRAGVDRSSSQRALRHHARELVIVVLLAGPARVLVPCPATQLN